MQNEMRDRLIDLLKETFDYTRGVCMDFDEAVEINADYLISNGVILPLVKVRDTVYQPSYKYTKCSACDYTPRWHDDSFCEGCESDCDSVEKPYIYKGKVCSIRITEKQIYLAVAFEEKSDSSSFILGENVFLTEEEAEAHLQKTPKGETE